MSIMKKLYQTEPFGLRICNYVHQDLDVGHTEGLHTHEFIKILRVTQGCADWQIGNVLHRIVEGDIFILNSSELRAFRTVYPPEPLSIDWIQFTPMTIFPNLKSAGVFYCRTTDFSNRIDRGSPHYQTVYEAFEHINENVNSNNILRDEAILAYLQILLVEITRCYKDIGQAISLPDSFYSMKNYHIISDAVNYISVHYNEQISESDVAKSFLLNTSQFSRLFSAYLCMSFPNYLRRIRLENTIMLLRENNGGRRVNVLDAAYACGFNSASGFYKTVKDLTGETPLELLNYNNYINV